MNYYNKKLYQLNYVLDKILNLCEKIQNYNIKNSNPTLFRGGSGLNYYVSAEQIVENITEKTKVDENKKLEEIKKYIINSKKLLELLYKRIEEGDVLITPKCSDEKTGIDCWKQIENTINSIDLDIDFDF
jgi:hypothetical protein